MQKQNISTIDNNKDVITTVDHDLDPQIEAVSLFFLSNKINKIFV
jgi:hypothetical protein